jgi:YesN/AraC family two-component response regulator
MKVLKVVIADDESIIRRGMKNLLDWVTMGFEIVGLAADGEQAITMVEEKQADILITDIRMPFLEGIELIREVKNTRPEVICLIITGYNEFIYAKRSLEAGAYAYLLKPVDPMELTRLLYRAKEEIFNRLKQKEYIQKLEIQVRSDPKSLETKCKEETVVQQVIKYIEKNLCKPSMSLLEVSKYAGYEPTYFSKLFKQETGTNFVNHLITRRIEKAKRLLENSQYSAKDVCEMVGYENYSHFSNLFKKITGKSPSHYTD